MSKLPKLLENPLDNLLIDLAGVMGPFLKATGHTPNMLTTYSVASGALSLAALWHDKFGAFAALWGLRVFWDDADGHFARTYGMETAFGDMYDHANDTLTMLGLLVVVHKKYEVPVALMVTFGVMLAMSMVHLGCQQRYTGKFTGKSKNGSSATIDTLQPLCPDVGIMHYTRWASHGTLHVFIVAAVWYMHTHCRRRREEVQPAKP